MDNNSKIQAVARGLTLGGALPLVPALVACSVVALTAWLAYRFRPRASDARSVLSKSEWTTFPLESRKALSRNAVLYRFSLPRKTDSLNLPIGQHIAIQAQIDGRSVVRSYTPTSAADAKGHFDLVVKTYEKGNVSRYLNKLKIGDRIKVRGPRGHMTYRANLAPHIGFIAGGTGITPCLQVIQAALADPNDKTILDLIYANVTQDDILLRQQIEDLARAHSDRFRLFYILNSPPSVEENDGKPWEGGVGFVTKDHIKQRFPPPSKMGKVLVCGPPLMVQAIKAALLELEYPKPNALADMNDQVFCF